MQTSYLFMDKWWLNFLVILLDLGVEGECGVSVFVRLGVPGAGKAEPRTQASAQGPRPAGIKAALTDGQWWGWGRRLRRAGVGSREREAPSLPYFSGKTSPLLEGEAERRLSQGGGRQQEWKPGVERTLVCPCGLHLPSPHLQGAGWGAGRSTALSRSHHPAGGPLPSWRPRPGTCHTDSALSPLCPRGGRWGRIIRCHVPGKGQITKDATSSGKQQKPG